MLKELNINEKIIRKGTLKETYSVKDKKLVNNILHYIIQSNNSNDIILSEYAIEKDFISTMQSSQKRSFVRLFKEKVKKILPSTRVK